MQCVVMHRFEDTQFIVIEITVIHPDFNVFELFEKRNSWLRMRWDEFRNLHTNGKHLSEAYVRAYGSINNIQCLPALVS